MASMRALFDYDLISAHLASGNFTRHKLACLIVCIANLSSPRFLCSLTTVHIFHCRPVLNVHQYCPYAIVLHTHRSFYLFINPRIISYMLRLLNKRLEHWTLLSLDFKWNFYVDRSLPDNGASTIQWYT